MYFPEDVECPINDIFIDNNYISNENYANIQIGTNSFLHCSNKNINGEIILDLRLGLPDVALELNYEKSNELCEWFSFRIEKINDCKKYYKFNTVSFYKIIDTWDINEFFEESFESYKKISTNDEINLYAVTYQGINSSLINKIDLIKKLNKNMKVYKNLTIIKIVLLVLNVMFFVFFLILISKKGFLNKTTFIISIIILLIEFIYFILAILSYTINKKYIQNIMNKINKDFEEHKIKNTFNLILIVFIIFYLVLYSLFIIFLFLCGQENIIKFNIKETCSKIKQFFYDCFKKDNNVNNNNYHNNNKDEDKNTSAISELNNPCCFCLSNPPKITFAPCGHQCCCQECYDKNKNSNNLKNCPICRRPIESIIEKIFKS